MSLSFRTLSNKKIGVYFPEIVEDTGSVINLNNPTGTLSNMASANSNTTYTLGEVIAGCYNKVLINAASEPSIIGAVKINGSNFEINTNMYMCVENNGHQTTYFFVLL